MIRLVFVPAKSGCTASGNLTLIARQKAREENTNFQWLAVLFSAGVISSPVLSEPEAHSSVADTQLCRNLAET